MGIKFQCPNGHKLHVKNFLAGKRAICPKCGARVVVPAESSMVAASEPEAAGDESLPEQSMEIPLAGALFDAIQAERSTASTPAPQSAAAPPPPGPPLHAIDEAPGAVWYVRPSGGGQFGPASGEIMRNWLDEGRVGATAMVWRAGWSEWRSAADVFPHLGGSLPPESRPAANGMPPLPMGQVVQTVAAAPAAPSAADSSPPPLAQAVLKRRRKKDVRLIASAILAVVSLILVIVLVLISRGSGDTKTEESPAAGEEELI